MRRMGTRNLRKSAAGSFLVATHDQPTVYKALNNYEVCKYALYFFERKWVF